MKALPNNNEVERWMKDTVKHSCHVEYYLNELDLGNRDKQRPHDLVGKYNKFDWKVLSGLSLVYRKDESLKKQIMDSVELHRNQYHHQMWNNPNPEATMEDLCLGVVDTVCSMLEKRVYSGEDEELGRKKSWSVIEDVLYNKSPEYKSETAKVILPQIREVSRPKLSAIKDIHDFPNIGIKEKIYEKMKSIINETTMGLEERGYDIFSKAL